MKKYLYSALALPLLFACSSEDFENEVVSNDQFAGIEKVDATFFMDEGFTRMDKGSWLPEEGDLWGFAWLTDAHTATPPYSPLITIDGKAYQNHNLIQKSNYFEPQTSIYVGKYFIYRPYDDATVKPKAIDFTVADQPLAEGYESAKQPWKNLAKTAINIGDKWTEVTPDGHTIGTDLTIWDKAGIKQNYKLYAAMFSNQTGLDLTYEKNNVDFGGKTISGATDIIDYTYPAGATIGAADIYEIQATLPGAAQSFTYAPKAEPNVGGHNGNFWETQKNLNTTLGATAGFGFVPGGITLTAPDETGVSTDNAENKGWFWFNSLPVTAGDAASTIIPTVRLETSYGVVTIDDKTLADCAWAYEDPAGTPIGQKTPVAWKPEWIKLNATDAAPTASTPRKWNPATHNTFINQYGNHKGKYALTVDFSKGVMNGMHIKNDAHLQKALKYYIASGKTEAGVVLNLDADANNEFKISKISIALLQTIGGGKVKVQACTSHGTPKIIITQDGQADLGLADKKEVPELNKVFAAATDVYLSKDCQWTWSGGDGDDALAIDANVTSITNEGTLKVNATNVELSVAADLKNAAGATMNITKVTTVKNDLTNLGKIYVGAADNTSAELRAYNAQVVNDATGLDDTPGAEEFGIIYNYGVVGKSAGTSGQVDNYGHINMFKDAITLLHSNELNGNTPPDGPFKTAFVAGTNMMGTVVLPDGNPYALVSVSNTDETGFIKYNWTADNYTHDTGNVKYNTIVVTKNITFTGAVAATEIKYIEFGGKRTQVVNPAASDKLPNLKGIIVNKGSSFILEKTNVLDCYDGAFLGDGATIYRGGAFLHQGADFAVAQTTNYLGTWSLDQIIEY